MNKELDFSLQMKLYKHDIAVLILFFCRHEQLNNVFEQINLVHQYLNPDEAREEREDDTRINMICGMNNTGISFHLSNSYLFTRKRSI